MPYVIHPKLRDDCFHLGNLTLCDVLLMNDARFPWVILVPRLENLRDFHELPDEHRRDLFDEIQSISRALEDFSHADKLNVAALGNQVPQLHVHIIARRKDDVAWPNPVWGTGSPQAYSEEGLLQIEKYLKRILHL